MKGILTLLLLSWFVCGVIATVAGFLGVLYPLVSSVLMGPMIVLGGVGFRALTLFYRSMSWSERILSGGLLLIWCLHFIGVLVPETAFDAVWYHLPIVSAFADSHQIHYLPELYQSVNPLFSDLIFLLGFQVAGEVGAKLVAYGLALTLAIVSYQLARKWLNRTWSLLFVIQVSLIQVVTWQASSFYVDVAKAMWEVGALMLLLPITTQPVRRSWLFLSALFFGASLATKQFSLVLLPIMSLIVFEKTRSWRQVGQWLAVALAVPLPFYLHSWVATGDPFFAITTHVEKVSEIGSQSTMLGHLGSQLIRLPYSLWYLTIEARDYVSPLYLLLLPLVISTRRMLWQERALILFTLAQWLIWWFVPPLSTRYALSGCITGLLLLFIATQQWVKTHPRWRGSVIGGIVIVTCFLLLPRLYVLSRSLPYLRGTQSKTEYLRQFFDGNIDTHLQRWHGLTAEEHVQR